MWICWHNTEHAKQVFCGKVVGDLVEAVEEQTGRTVRLSSNDHPEMGVLISQLPVFKTTCFNIALSPLGVQGLNAKLVCIISVVEFVI